MCFGVCRGAGDPQQVLRGRGPKRDMDEYDFVTFDQQLSADWLGSPGKPGKFASVLKSTADFLVAQKSIRSAPKLDAFQKAINTTFLAQAAKA